MGFAVATQVIAPQFEELDIHFRLLARGYLHHIASCPNDSVPNTGEVGGFEIRAFCGEF
jgi:hypothetical protein